MIQKIVSDLNNIAAKPGATPSTLLIVTRRTCRILVVIRDSVACERKGFLRTAEKLRKKLPHSVLDIEVLEDLAVTHRRDEYDYACSRLAELGRLMSADGSQVAYRLGFDRLCDILNVSNIHRVEARQKGGETLQGLIYEARAEDSVEISLERRGDGPLCQAFYSVLMEEAKALIRAQQESVSRPEQFAERATQSWALSTFHAALVMVH